MSAWPAQPIEFLPSGDPAPALMTETEAAAFLRLADDGQDAEAARRAMNHLVDRGLVRPCLVGGKRRYSRRELDRFIDAETEKWSPMSEQDVARRRRVAESNKAAQAVKEIPG